MMFHTTAFILEFLPVCLTGFFALGRFFGAAWALRWLVACSLFFYAWWNPEHLPLLVGSVVLNHAIARTLRHTNHPRAWLTAGVTLNLAILGWFKYADFLLHIVAPHAPALHITLPLAISFFTFQQIMFLADTAAGDRGTAGIRAPDQTGHGPAVHSLSWPGLSGPPIEAVLGGQPMPLGSACQRRPATSRPCTRHHTTFPLFSPTPPSSPSFPTSSPARSSGRRKSSRNSPPPISPARASRTSPTAC